MSMYLLFFHPTPCTANCKKVVYVYNWAHYIPEELLEKFEKETGITVVYDTFESLEELETKLFSRIGYDVVFPCACPTFAQGIKADIFLALNYQLLPDVKELNQEIMNKLSDIDPHHRYGLPYLCGTTGIGYDVDQIKTILPDTPLDSWGLIFSKENAEKLSRCNIALSDSATDVFQAALLYLGYSPSTTDLKAWKEATDIIMNIRPYIKYFSSSGQTQSILDRQVCITQGWSTYIHVAKKEGEKLIPPCNISYIIPKEGAVMWIDMMAIPKHAPHPLYAHKFINFILRPENIAAISNKIGAPNAIEASYPLINPELRKNETLFPSAEVLKKLHSETVYSTKFQRYISRTWLKIKTLYKE